MASTEIQYSPPRKRQRMSSPAYDVEEMTGSDFDALDEIEVRHSQKMFTLQQRSQSDERQAQKLRDIEKTLASAGSEGDSRAKAEDPSVQSSPHVSSTSIGAHIGTTSNAHVASLPGFTSARNLPNIAPPDIPSSSPDVPPERDYAAWFESDSNLSMNAGFTSANLLLAKGPGDKDDDFASNLEDNSASQSAFAPDAGVVPVLGFTSAKALSRAEPSINPGTSFSGFQSAKFVEDSFVAPSEVDMSAMSGFTSARTAATTTMSGPSPLLLPSAKGPDKFALSEEALKRAAERLKQWEEDDDENEFGAHDVPETPTRPSIRPVQKPAVTSEEIPRLISRVPTFSKPSVSAVGSTPLTKPKAFKSPLLPSTQKATLSSSNIPRYTNSPLNPNPKRKPLAAYNNANKDFASPAHPVEKPAPPPTPLSASPAIFSTPRKLLGVTPRRSAVSSTPVRKFVTPFKPGLRPGEPGRMQLEQENAKKKATFAAPKIATSPAPRRASNTGVKGKWFDMTPVPDRQTLLSSGLMPQSYTQAEMQLMGVNIAELCQITPTSAMYYAFNTESSVIPSASQIAGSSALLDPQAMLEQLLAQGCRLASQAWVDNHWGLILWKVAGMVSLDPKPESNPGTRRWCWRHIREQFLYRYEKELEGGARPPLRLIATQDAPASLPMVLCVSNISWSSGGVDHDGLVMDQIPELELTDGWYKLRAEVDGALTRAIKKGKIRVGRKLAVQNARLSSDHKDPTEVLEAYDRCHLVLAGNSCHLAPWHAKLGFSSSPSFATLGSLTSDGGVVTIVELAVVKAHPVAFIEFVEGSDGKTRRIGPRNEKEEMKARDQWARRREDLASKLRDDIDRKISTLEGYAHRLDAKAGSAQGKTEDEDPPPHIDTYYDDLEEGGNLGTLLCRLSKSEMRWLSETIRKNCATLRENAREETEKELAFECPPRKVRNFRVVVAEDARTRERKAYRRAQITVWDVLDLGFGEGTKAGAFLPDQRFLVTNLIPTQQSAWMANEPGAEVYLTTRRDSKWTKMN